LKKGRHTLLTQLSAEERTMIFYESPMRLVKTLEQFIVYFGAYRPCSVSRELSKKFEENKRGTLAEVCAYYKAKGVKGEIVVVVGGKEYGTGSSRDWAAKGTMLLGVKAVVAQSYERIHRSNLVGMGVLPLQFEEGTSAQTLGLDGSETFDVLGLSEEVKPRQMLTLRITKADGQSQDVPVVLRIDTPIEVEYYRHGGILPFVLRELMAAA
jgi:aconitate hydratase